MTENHPQYNSGDAFPPESTYLRELLRRANLGQHEAADRLGIDRRTFRKYCAATLTIPPYVTLACERLADLAS